MPVPRARRPKTATASRSERRRSREVSRSRLWLIGSVVVSAAVLGAWFPASALYSQRTSLSASRAQLHQLQEQNAALAQEAKNLSSTSEIDRIAREQYQLVTPGQQAFEILPATGAAGTTPTTTATTAHHASHPTSSAPPGIFARMAHALEFWR
jgi:cell division protein FtsB